MKGRSFYDVFNCQAKGSSTDTTVGNDGKTVVPRNERTKEGGLPIYEYQLEEVTKENRMKLFNRHCPSCGNLIIGRPCEWPYYVRKGNKYVWFCEKCSWITRVSVIRELKATEQEKEQKAV